jgi:hypothetical protein
MTGEADEPDRSDTSDEHQQLRETVRSFLADVDRTYDEYEGVRGRRRDAQDASRPYR